jgi:two-component system cell cycle response regulator
MPNRRYIDEVLRAECERALRDGTLLSIAMADVDHFKHINDTYGHDAGDEVLRQLGALAREGGSGNRVAGRYGGDELVFIMPELCLQHASDAADEWRAHIAAHEFRVDSGLSVPVAVSIGVAEVSGHRVSTPDDLLRLADAALYDAKRTGRNRVITQHPVDNRRVA